MASIKLGNRPKTFRPVTIKVPLPDGEEGIMQVTYKYRTRTEFGKLIDSIFKDAGENRTDGNFSMGDLMEKTRDKNAEYLLLCVDAWNLDDPVTMESLRQLSDELPAVAAAIMEQYRTAALEGRLGN